MEHLAKCKIHTCWLAGMYKLGAVKLWKYFMCINFFPFSNIFLIAMMDQAFLTDVVSWFMSSLQKDILKSKPILWSVALFGNRVFADIVKLRWGQ